MSTPSYHPCGVCASYRDVCVYCREAMAMADEDAAPALGLDHSAGRGEGERG